MAEEWTWYIWATVGTLASIVSVAFWKRIKARRHRQDEDKLLQGRFGKRVAQVKACARKTEMESEKKPAASVLSGWCPMRGAGDEGTDAQDSDGELDTTYPEEDIDALNDAVNRHGTGDLETNVAGSLLFYFAYVQTTATVTERVFTRAPLYHRFS
uniref:Uncharacterized protein n=1 Tax=Plectus sambesii TaxID=2011161 RepID=A0A914XLK8_9BILA